MQHDSHVTAYEAAYMTATNSAGRRPTITMVYACLLFFRYHKD